MSGTPRVNLGAQHPSSKKALAALSTVVEQNATESGLAPLTIELIKLRTSQINGCAFCLRLHTREATLKGETAERLAILSAWRETDYFSPQERAALALAESITLVARTHVDDSDYLAFARALSDEQLSAVAWLCTVMNAFNRVAITSRNMVSPE